MANYVQNTYNWLKRRGLAKKYEHAGIYCIKVNNQIVYIGKSLNMLWRIAQHYVGIQTGSEKKYRILSELQRKGHPIDFDVLYYASSCGYEQKQAEIGIMEGEFIRKYLPVLNTQIPKEDDWHKWDINEVDAREVLNLLLEDK